MSAHSALAASQVKAAAPIFAALGDETRLRILAKLAADGPVSIAHLSTASPVTRQAVTKHLEVLESAGLVRGEKRGRERIWELEPRRLADAHGYLEKISAEWDGALGRLKSFVER
ncbi:MAG TPA: metalloregulator ArsR/SmtB family transcription factor [Polyangiaceae bacterium]|jgi:DNA-binding transcriptional ArsR family regulator|nr:metalloregulator ArsR/SmtB family transcription factor [Polyangiaceae bacterium]